MRLSVNLFGNENVRFIISTFDKNFHSGIIADFLMFLSNFFCIVFEFCIFKSRWNLIVGCCFVGGLLYGIKAPRWHCDFLMKIFLYLRGLFREVLRHKKSDVPKTEQSLFVYKKTENKLSLWELESFSCFFLTEFFSFYHSWVTS